MLLCLLGSIAMAGESRAGSMSPNNSALHLDNATGEPCPETMPKGALDLLDVVNLALCSNPQTREVWAYSRVQEAQVGVSKAAYLPNASMSASDIRIKSGADPVIERRNINLTLSYLLYDFGLRSAKLDNALQLLAAASATQDSTVQKIFLAAVQGYYQVQAALAAFDAAIESEHTARESFAAAEARYNAGSATPADKLQAQTAYSQATLNRITADGNLKNAQGALANMIGVDANRNVPLATANAAEMPRDFEGDINALIEEARQRRPDLQAAAAQVKAAQASADAARSDDMPKISLTASSDRQQVAGINTRDSSVGIQLNVPIFSGYTPAYRIRAAEMQVEASNAQLEQLRLQVALEVWTAYQHLTTATQSLRTTADLLNSAEQSERVVLGRYKAGVGSMLDVLNAQSALASARQQRIQSTLNWNISRATLAQAMGSLDAGLLQTLSNGDGHKPGEAPPSKNKQQ